MGVAEMNDQQERREEEKIRLREYLIEVKSSLRDLVSKFFDAHDQVKQGLDSAVTQMARDSMEFLTRQKASAEERLAEIRRLQAAKFSEEQDRLTRRSRSRSRDRVGGKKRRTSRK